MPDEISATSSESETATLAVNKRIPSDGWTPRRVRLQAVISCVHSSSVHGAGLLTQRLAGPIQHVVSNASYPQSRQVGFTSESPVARLFTFSPSGWLRGEAEMAAASLVQPGTSLTRQSSTGYVAKVLYPCQVPLFGARLFQALVSLHTNLYVCLLFSRNSYNQAAIKSYYRLLTTNTMPRTPGKTTKHLTEVDRRRIRTLYSDVAFQPAEISRITGFSVAQVKYSIRANSLTPKRRSRRPLDMTQVQVDQLVLYVMGSKATRRMTYLELSLRLFNSQFSQHVIRRMLWQQGFRRRVARRKPPISEANRVKRLAFAEEYKDWSIDQWSQILWTDETWVAGGTHRQVLMTRRAGEEYDPTCIQDRFQRKKGWMFWGCFAGYEKGPGLFWEKDWGSINSQSYADHTVPLIHGWLQLQQGQGK